MTQTRSIARGPVLRSFLTIEKTVRVFIMFLPSSAKTFLFYSTLILFISVFSFYILLPLFRIFSVFKQLSDKQANTLLIKFFPELKDKLLNIIELILYEDDHFIILNKPPFISSLDDRHDHQNMLSLVRGHIGTAQL